MVAKMAAVCIVVVRFSIDSEMDTVALTRSLLTMLNPIWKAVGVARLLVPLAIKSPVMYLQRWRWRKNLQMRERKK